MHADMLDAMGIDDDGILCIHGGGVYGNKEKTIERWIENFKQLPPHVQKRLCIENCERCYSVKDCLRIADSCNIPLILDSHHFDCYNLIPLDISDYMDHVILTWTRRNITPVFHISEQRPDARIGAHSDYIKKIPEYMYDYFHMQYIKTFLEYLRYLLDLTIFFPLILHHLLDMQQINQFIYL